MLNSAVISLILSNLVTVYGVIFWGWSFANLLFLFWFENVVLGFFTALKILITKVDILGKILLLVFFTMHYGLFTLVHGVFLLTFFRGPFFFSTSLLIGLASMFLSHGVSFIINFVLPKKYLIAHPVILMMAPYPRIIVVQLTIILSGFFIMLNQTVVPLIIFTLLKMMVDLASHLVEHRSENTLALKPFAAKAVIKFFPNFEHQIQSMYKMQANNGQWDQIVQNMDPEDRKTVEEYFMNKGLMQKNTIEQSQDGTVGLNDTQ